MLQSQEEIWQELEETIRQLIDNASLLEKAVLHPAEECLLRQTQESLLAKLYHTQELLVFKQSKKRRREELLKQKLLHLQELSLSPPQHMGKTHVRIGRNRKHTRKESL
ncbi:MAG: hypothetical protein FJZ58_00255 [Chlamydiae bacterium]|nr:hypothetical protein [Chlamydiota bacterium]